MLVLVYLPRKDGKLSWLRRKTRTHKFFKLCRDGIEMGTLWSERTAPIMPAHNTHTLETYYNILTVTIKHCNLELSEEQFNEQL